MSGLHMGRKDHERIFANMYSSCPSVTCNCRARGISVIWPQLTFLEFHFETEVKVDFPSACI